LLKTNLKIER